MITYRPLSLSELMANWSFRGFLTADEAVDYLAAGRVKYFGLQSIKRDANSPVVGVSGGRRGHFVALVADDGRWIISPDNVWRIDKNTENVYGEAIRILGLAKCVDKFPIVPPRTYYGMFDDEAEDEDD